MGLRQLPELRFVPLPCHGAYHRPNEIWLSNQSWIWLADVPPAQLQRKMVEVLTHESRHAWQAMQRGPTIFWRERLPFIGLAALNTLWLSILLELFWLPMPGGLTKIISAVLINFIIIRTWMVVELVGLRYFEFAGYRYSWSETDARRFSRQALKDPAWLAAVEVETLSDKETKSS